MQASGARLSALTRNRLDDERLVVSPDGRLLAVHRSWRGVAGEVVLVSADGRRERRIEIGERSEVAPEAFSPDGSRLAIRARRGGSGDDREWWAVGVAYDNGSLRVVTPDEEDYEFVDWSPDGQSLLLRRERYDERDDVSRIELVIDGLTGDPPRTLVRDFAFSEADWGSTGRIAFTQKRGTSLEELHLIDPDGGSDTLVATSRGDIEIPSGGGDWHDLTGWSPNGRLFAYWVENSDDSKSLYLATSSGRSRLLLRDLSRRALRPEVAWSPRSDALAVETARGLLIVGTDGRVRTRVTPAPSPDVGVAWSPDASRLALVVSDGGAVRNLWLASAATGRARRLTRRGDVLEVQWAPGAVPATAARARAVPPTERLSAGSLTARAPITEISASGRRVAAIVASNVVDCTHVVAWQPGGRSIVHFETPAPCGRAGWSEYYELELTGTHLRWIDFCGMRCGDYGVAADLRRPGALSWGSDPGPTHGPRHPAPPREFHRGVTMTLERGTIVLRRTQGSARRIRPPGGAVDAELEATGLFYAYGRRTPARIVFVPFGRLFG